MQLGNTSHADWTIQKPTELWIIAHDVARLTSCELTAIRKDSFSNLPVRLSPQLLRHSDEQTLAALTAVAKASNKLEARHKDLSNWAVISSSQNLGRRAFAGVIDKYRNEGPWGVSVQVIPHCTAHAVAGTISLALASHGPCIGVGGCTDGQVDTLLSAASILRRSNCEGAWITFSASSPEQGTEPNGQMKTKSHCVAAAIAVTTRACPGALGRIILDLPCASESSAANRDEQQSAHGDLLTFMCEPGGTRVWSSPPSCAVHVQTEFWGDGSQTPSESSTHTRMSWSGSMRLPMPYSRER